MWQHNAYRSGRRRIVFQPPQVRLQMRRGLDVPRMDTMSGQNKIWDNGNGTVVIERVESVWAVESDVGDRWLDLEFDLGHRLWET